MNYLVFRQQRKGVPTILALLIVGLMVLGIGYLVKNKPDISVSLPSSSNVALLSTITGNIRDNTVSIFWKTSAETKGYILLGSSEKSLTREIFDDRDVETNLSTRNNHIVTIDSLEPNTTYYYYIMADGKKIGQAQNIPFQVKTADGVNSLLTQEGLFGTIRQSNRLVLDNGIVVFTIDGAESLITATKADGSFTLSPCCLRKGTRGEVFLPEDETPVDVKVFHTTGEESYTYTYGDLRLADELVLGESVENYDGEEEVVLQEEFLQKAALVETYENIDVIYPRQDSIIPDTKPLYKGLGIPGTEVKGRIEPDGKLFRVTVDEEGLWSYTPSLGLEPGSHSLQVQALDEDGNTVGINRNFIVLKSGEAVLGESTPSATLTPEATVSPTETPDGTPTTEPTIIVPTATEGPTPTALPSGIPTKPPPVSGSNILPFASVSLVLIMIGMGAYLLY